jgi:mRNA interferase RelE/StbE
MLRIELSRQAAAFLQELPAKQARQIVGKLDGLATIPPTVVSETLRGGEGERRAKAGEFRIVFEVVENTLVVLLVDRRNDDRIYRRLARR